MPTSCAAFGCTERNIKGNCISFHRFPKDATLKKKWIIATRRENWTPTSGSRLCSKHFPESAYNQCPGLMKKKLCDNAIPTIFNFPKHLQKEVKPRKTVRRNVIEEQASSSTASESWGEPEPRVFTSQATTSSARRSSFPDHAYHIADSPRKLKAKYNALKAVLEEKVKRLKAAQVKARRVKKKAKCLAEVLDAVKKEKHLSDEKLEELSAAFSTVKFDLLTRKPKTKQRYPDSLQKFALTLHYFSPRAYNFVRNEFNLCLPHPSTLRKWCGNSSGSPGFTQQALESLQKKVEEAREEGKTLYFSLVSDEMAIKKHIDLVAGKPVGYVDLGTEMESPYLPEAKDVLVFMVVGINSDIKMPCAFFLTAGLNGEERSSLVKLCLEKLHDHKVNIVSYTFDGAPVHFTMAKILGADLRYPDPIVYFTHPSDKEKRVYILLDPCHMIKLVRNTLGDRKILLDGDGKEIQWQYLSTLHNIQWEQGLKFGNRLGNAHIYDWRKKKMKVKLAVQLLSSSVANALRFCKAKLQSFKECEATIKFIEIFDRLFDVLNSRNPLAKTWKSPLNPQNEETWVQFLEEAEMYISSIWDPHLQEPVCISARRTGFIGFLISIRSVCFLYRDLVKGDSQSVEYLRTYRLNQDHLEHFFGTIRGMGGFNDNPSSAQFMSAYRKLLLIKDFQPCSSNTNCSAEMEILQNVQSAIMSHSMESESLEVIEEEIPEPPSELISILVENIVDYIAGYIARQLIKSLNCWECKQAIVGSDASEFTAIKNENGTGNLVIPSEDVCKVCKIAETEFRSLTVPIHDPKIVTHVCVKVLSRIKDTNIFQNLHDHIYDTSPEENHVVKLAMKITYLYCKVRICHIMREKNASFSRGGKRQTTGRAIIFQHL